MDKTESSVNSPSHLNGTNVFSSVQSVNRKLLKNISVAVKLYKQSKIQRRSFQINFTKTEFNVFSSLHVENPNPVPFTAILAICSYLWLSVAICSYLWLSVVICGYLVICICSYLWLSVAICSYLWLSVAICGYL